MSSLFCCKSEFPAPWYINIGVLWIFTMGHVMCASTRLDPALFPAELKKIFNSLSTEFDCNFNHKSFCAFQFVSTEWSFHQSMRELAEKLRIAAEAAANALSTATNASINASVPNLQEMELTPVTVPQANYFPCVSKTANRNSSNQTFCILELSVPWPRFTSFSAPAGRPLPGIGLFDLASDSTQALSKQYISASPPSAHESTDPIACLQVNFRFPPNQSSQVNIDFVSPLQTLRSVLPGTPDVPHSLESTISSSSTLPEIDTLPHDVWVELTVPVPAASGMTESGRDVYSLYDNTAALPSFVFGDHNIRWVATLIPTSLRLRITSGVCVDNFRFRSLQPDEIHSNSCTRSLRWVEPVTAENNQLLIDEFGIPVPLVNAVPVMGGTNTPLLRVYEPRGLMNDMDWLRFTGSLVLSVTVTLLFLLFVSVIGLSITMARGRHGRTRPCRFTAAESHGNHSKDAHDSLLSEITCPAPNDIDVQSVDPEPGSTQGGESLFHNGTDTFRSRGDAQVENPMLGSNMGSTASVQLLRNWYFYRRKANRTRHHPRSHEAHPASQHPSPLVSSPAFPYELVTRPLQRRNTATAADNPCRHSFVLSADEANQLVILPAFHSGSAPSTSMRGPRGASDTHLGIIPESPFYTSENLSLDRAIQWETDHNLAADCVHSLDSISQSPSAPPPPDYNTLSTVPRSQLSVANESNGSVGFNSRSPDSAVSDSIATQ